MKIKRPQGFGPATHIVPLMLAFMQSEGDVLEIGTGKFSTDLLSWLCALYGRKLVSYENDKEWLEKLRKKVASGYSEESYDSFWTVVTAPIPKDLDFKDRKWGVVFVDNSPALERYPMVLELKDHADFIVIHDVDPHRDHAYLFSKTYPQFKYVYFYTDIEPWTAVVSNFKRFKEVR